ncbi:MAG: hypothetical protein QOK37_2651 [Thermoanaerobaculia bacterium]|jgi:hypothetical protein|nr:hypothetical protein [Thermoanaerobaculia bacterium]
MRSVGIVCGYDLNDELPGYVTSVAPLIARENPDFLILSGGRTSPRSDHSEAWMMARYLRETMPAREVVLEEHSMTTLENLLFARGLAEHHAGAVARFVVFCDRVHRRKVATLARLILGARAVVQPVHRRAAALDRLFEPASHLIEAVVAVVPRLRKYLRAAAIFAKGVSGKPPDSALPPLPSDDQPQHRRLPKAIAVTGSSLRP